MRFVKIRNIKPRFFSCGFCLATKKNRVGRTEKYTTGSNPASKVSLFGLKKAAATFQNFLQTKTPHRFYFPNNVLSSKIDSFNLRANTQSLIFQSPKSHGSRFRRKSCLFLQRQVSCDDPNLSTRTLKWSTIVLSKYARDAQVVRAEFVKSSVRTEDCPSDGLPEFAFVGCSIVGKSSLLNSFVRRKRLALTSKKPWYVAAPQELRTDWSNFMKDCFLNCSTLVSVFLLIDSSIPAKAIDLEYASWFVENQIPVTLLFTKYDKRKKKKNGGKRSEENVSDFQELIRGSFQTVPPSVMTSSVTNQGLDEMRYYCTWLNYGITG